MQERKLGLDGGGPWAAKATAVAFEDDGMKGAAAAAPGAVTKIDSRGAFADAGAGVIPNDGIVAGNAVDGEYVVAAETGAAVIVGAAEDAFAGWTAVDAIVHRYWEAKTVTNCEECFHLEIAAQEMDDRRS